MSLYERGARIAQSSLDRRGEMMALVSMGEVAAVTGDAPTASQALSKALRFAEELADPLYEASALINLGIVAFLGGGTEQAARHFRRALKLATYLHSTYLVAACLDGLAAAISSKDSGQATRLFITSDSLRTRAGVPRSRLEASLYEPFLITAGGEVDEAIQQQIKEAAGAMTLEDAAASASLQENGVL